MSLDSWKAEYYPESARGVREEPESALWHSLQKWYGLRAENMARHGLTHREGAFRIVDPEPSPTEEFTVDANTCALCQVYDKPDGPDEESCRRCPLFLFLGRRCDTGTADLGGYRTGEYQHWHRNSDAGPMIHALQEAYGEEMSKVGSAWCSCEGGDSTGQSMVCRMHREDR